MAITASAIRTTPQSSNPGPIRRVRVQKKRPAGYGLFYSSDEEEMEDETNATRTLSTTKATTTSTINTASAPGRSGLKTLMFEKRHYTQEELFGTTAPANPAPTSRPSPPVAASSPKSARAARKSPYGAPAPLSRRPLQAIDVSDDDLTMVKTPAGRSKYTMRGGLQTPPQRHASPVTTPQSRQVVKQQKQPAAPPPPPAPASTLVDSPFKAITGFLSAATGLLRRTAVIQPAELVREMDVEITPASQSSSSGSPAASEQAENNEEEEEKRWPGAFNKTPVKENPHPEYINPALALEPYAQGPRPIRIPWSFDDGHLGNSRHGGNYSSTDKKRTRLSLSYDGHNRSKSFSPRTARRQIPGITTSTVSTNDDASKRARLSLNLASLSKEERERIAEERLLDLERAERDRRVQAQEDKYERRRILHELGRDWLAIEEQEAQAALEAEASTDDDSATEEERERRRREKSKGKQKERERTDSESPEARAASPPPEPASQPTSFLFGGGAYKPPAVAPAAPDNATVSLPPSSPTKSPAPPATPTLAHATLPNPAAPSGSALLPPSASPSLTSPQKAVSGLGLADPALKARSQAEKFKPHVSSGLRASTTIPADSPPRAGRNAGPLANPPKMTLAPPTPAPAPAPVVKPAVASALVPSPEKKKFVPAPMHPLKVKKLGPHSDWIQAQLDANAAKADQGYLEKFLGALGGGKREDKVLLAVDNVWRQPREEEVKGVIRAIVDAVVTFNFAPL